MSNLREQAAAPPSRKRFWLHAYFMVATACASGLVALVFFPAAFEQADDRIGYPISNADTSDHGKYISPEETRLQKLSDAKTAVHGMYVKDPYGCVYMFQYLSAQLSLTPVLDAHQRQVCLK